MGKSKSHRKKRKDPRAPKKALSAYLFFCGDKRDGLIQQNPHLKFPEVSKLLGPMWRDLDANEKAKYELMAQKDKERYQAAQAEYLANKSDSSDSSSIVGRKKKKKKDPNAPKNALSAYMIFCKHMRPNLKAQNPDATFEDMGKILGDAWKTATPDVKEKFQQLAAKDKERHEAEMRAYNDTL